MAKPWKIFFNLDLPSEIKPPLKKIHTRKTVFLEVDPQNFFEDGP